MLTLAPDAHAVRVGDDLVVLQTGSDRYLCLPGAGARLQLTQDRRGLVTSDQDLLEALRSAGISGPAGDQASSGSCPPALPTRDRPAASDALRPVDILRLAGAVSDLARGYIGRPLGDILRFVRTATEVETREPDAEFFRLVHVFHRLAPWLPISGKCLVRSFVLLRFLQRSGRDAGWVFGVRVWPFSAHCWLQVGDVVLDDHADRLHAYEPILRT